VGASTRVEVAATPAGSPEADQLWRALDGSGAANEVVGGKAAMLDQLLALGAPVPPSAVLTTAAYRRVFAQLERTIERAAATAEPGSDDYAREIEHAVTGADLPADVAEAIERAAAHASADRWPVAVRSSATAEDTADASFAGQYRTELNVEPADVGAAVRRCWASLWSPRACAYRVEHGVDDDRIAMAVIIQAMVPAAHSGVAFTVDPTGEHRDVIRIESVRGLGEKLVSGAETPDVLLVPRALVDEGSLDIVTWQRRLAAIALRAERVFDGAQDLEWSVTSDGVLFVLQARPVTAVAPPRDDGFDSPPIPGVTWTPLGVAEMLPGVMPPLLWTINGALLDDAFRWLYGRLGVDVARQPLVARFHGQAVLNLSAIQDVATRVPGGSLAEVQRQYVGEVLANSVAEPARRAGWITRLRTAVGAFRLRRQLVADAGAFLEAVDVICNNSPDLSELTPASLVEYRHALRSVARLGYSTEVGVAASAAAAYRAVEVALGRWLDDDDEAVAVAQRVTAGAVGEHAGGAAVLALSDLAAEIADDDEMRQVVCGSTPADIAARMVELGDRPARLIQAVLARARRAGCTTVYGGVTWDESDEELWPILQEQVAAAFESAGGGSGPGPGPRDVTPESVSAARALGELFDRITRTRRWRMTRVVTGQVVDVRRRMLRRVVAEAREFLRLREELKSAILRLGGEERRAIRQLAITVALDDEDIAMCADAELDDLALGRGTSDRSELRRRREANSRLHESPPLPGVFTGPPREAASESAPGELRGRPASAGVATGRARLARTRSEAAALKRGEVLVGTSTDPSWTPLFGRAAAIVMERGGPLSHAAIVARELDVPAVLGVERALSTIPEGATVRVDGSRGTVDVVANGGSAGGEEVVAS
jgi:phosphohistidine swiveling domain-containing protein